MVNAGNQTAIALFGAGFKPRRNGEYLPGEFRRLTNVEALEDRLRNRRSIRSVGGIGPGNNFGFIGTMGQYAISANATVQHASGPDGIEVLWAPTSLSVPAAVNSFNKLIGYFRYNNRNHWLTLKFDAGTNIKITMLHGAIDNNNDSPSAYGPAYFASLTAVDLITIPVADAKYNKFAFKNFFLQGDRLWIVTSTGIYYSKIADPTIFAVPDGGFFLFPDQNINWGMAIREDIYVLCDNTISHITYNADPAGDGRVRRLSDNLGAESGCIHQDTPYVVNNIGVYRIANGYLDKILDNELDMGMDFYNNSIRSFGEYLLINKHTPVNYEKFDSIANSVRTNLVINPSLQVNSTGWAGNYTYANRSRDAAKGYSRVSSMKGTTINDTTVTVRTNRIANPSFEINFSSWFFSGSASFIAGGSSGAQRGRNTQTNYTPGHHGPIISPSVFTHVPTMSGIVAGTSYTFSFDMLRGLATPSYSKLELFIRWKDGVGNDLQTDSIVYYNSLTNALTTKSFTKTAPTDAVNAECWIEVGYYDDAFCTDVWLGTAVTDIDSVYFGEAGGYFDGDTADVANDSVYSWTGAGGISTSTLKGQKGNKTEIAEYGTAAAGVGVLKPAVIYKIGLAVWGSGVHNIGLKVTTYNAANAQIASVTLTDSGNNTVNNAWAYLVYQYSAPANAHHCKITVFINNTVVNPNLDFWVDALIMETGSTWQGYFDGATPDTNAVTYAWTGAVDASSSTATISALPRRQYQSGKRFTPGESGNILGYNLYALNTDTGSLHVIDFTDHRDTSSQLGYVTDILVNYNKDVSGNYNCFFMTARLSAETEGSYTFANNAYFMNTAYELDFFDEALTSVEVLNKYAPKVEIEVENISPSLSVNQYATGVNAYNPKKFRNLEFMGKLPFSDIEMQVAYNNEANWITTDLNVGDQHLLRPHWPFRVALMQRAYTISLLLRNANFNTPLADGTDYGQLEISDMQILWQPTYRRPDRRALVR